MDAPVAIAHPRLGDLLDPLHQDGLPGTFGTVVVSRSIDRQSLAGTPDADLPNHPNLVDHLSLPGRPHISAASCSNTIRLRLLKLGARVVETAFRVRLAFAAACPDATLIRYIAAALMPAGPVNDGAAIAPLTKPARKPPAPTQRQKPAAKPAPQWLRALLASACRFACRPATQRISQANWGNNILDSVIRQCHIRSYEDRRTAL
jgi:hypothetical protein